MSTPASFIAVTSSVYAEPEAPRVWLVDAETGALEHAFEKQIAVADEHAVHFGRGERIEHTDDGLRVLAARRRR